MSGFYELQEITREKELQQVLEKLICDWEYEVVEFKEANNDFDKNKIGEYFSAIRNLLTSLKNAGIITTDSDNQQLSSWVLVK